MPISITDTESDLSLLVKNRTKALGVVGPDDRGTLAEKILDKSMGSFLWTILVLEELIRCHSRREIYQILEDVPRGMESLYKRTLDYMSQAARGKELAKNILMWAVCAIRPMTISELDGALTLDTHDSFPRLEESITTLCGELVVVDKYGRVNMVHETARQFLVSGGLESEFFVEKTQAHTDGSGVSQLPCRGRNEASEEQPTPSFGTFASSKIRFRRLCIHSILLSSLEV